jgi:transposase
VVFVAHARSVYHSDLEERLHAITAAIPAANRKNALFAGSDGGAEHWAAVASLIETCKLNDIDPLVYLTDVLTRIVSGHPNRDIDQLLPWAYRKQDLRAVA